MRRFALSLSLLVAPFAAQAQNAYLVKDINTTTVASPASSSPINFFGYGSSVVFAATGTNSGRQLWITDGTAAGTTMLTKTGSDAKPGNFAILNRTLLFNATDFTHGEELWMSDGTAAGTRLLADINPNAASAVPGDHVVYHGAMLFAANDGVDGSELWVTDGTPAGTHFFKDLAPGSASSAPRGFVILNDTIYFGAAGALWKSDGTPAGTVPVKSGVEAVRLSVAGGRIFFFASTGNGLLPWVSDGTETGTYAIVPAGGAPASFSPYPVPFGDRVLFVASTVTSGYELWISDGTPSGTHIVREINPGPASGVTIPDLAVVGNVAYFAASPDLKRVQLWKTDGTEAGTVMVRDFGAGGTASSVVVAGDKVYFIAAAAGDAPTLWVSDGTADGTRVVKPGAPPAVTGTLASIGDVLYFAGANRVNGAEPWRSDGTDSGTQMIANLGQDGAPSSSPRDLTPAGNSLFFTAWDGSGTPASGEGPRSLWHTDGTAAGTVELSGANAFGTYTAVGPSLFFTRDGVLWSSDGTPAGTAPATAFSQRFPQQPTIVATSGNTIFATVQSDLWATTNAPNAPAVSLGVRNVFPFIFLAGRAYFFTSATLSNGLWTSDGTAAGTYAVVPALAEPPYGNPAVAAGQLFFTTRMPTAYNLWKSDGTMDGTVFVATLAGLPSPLAAAGRNVFWIAANQLWVSDGTQSGTHAVSAAPLASITPVAAGDRVVFVAGDSATGNEVWASDGTNAGTHLLRDIYPGTTGSSPSNFVASNGLVYFSAFDGVHGTELWVTDGTTDGTQLACDIEPGPLGSSPSPFAAAGDRIFIAATTTATGRELWALPVPGTRLSIDDARVVEGDSGTTTARFAVTLSAPATQPVTVDYATSDGTASAGSDYDAASGTLTFAPGETAKGIDVVVHGDTTPENNETFFVTLRNVSGATVVKREAFGVIEDDDQFADLALSADFSRLNGFDAGVVATNNGPRSATGINVTVRATPGQANNICTTCTTQLAPGATGHVFDASTPFVQQYFSATVTARQRDPQPSNNSVSWTAIGDVAMDALNLTPGSQANVWFSAGSSDTSATATSSDPGIVAVPSTIAVTPGKMTSFVVRGVAAGRATIAIKTNTRPMNPIAIDVVPAGASMRYPGAFAVNIQPQNPSFDRQLTATVITNTSAPFSGASATGPITIAVNGHVVATATLTAAIHQTVVPFFLTDVGQNTVVVSYAGDANFLPDTATFTIYAQPGLTSILANVERNGTDAVVHVRVNGSPNATPTGTTMVQVVGAAQTATAALRPLQAGIAVADVPVANFSSGTLFIAYSGDAHYAANSQTIRISDVHKRSTRH